MNPTHFICNFDPVIFRLTDAISLRYYGLAYLLGFIAVIYFSLWQAKIKQLKISREKLSDLIFYLFLAMIFGARLGHFVFYDPQNFQNFFYIWQGGMSFHGGFIAVALASFFLAKHYKISLLALADLLIFPSFLALAFGRLGNFFNCEIYGRPAENSWSIIFPQVDFLPRHPAQLYEFLLYFCIFCTLYFFVKTRPQDGKIFFWSLILISSARFFNEFFRVPDYFISGWFTIGQLLSLPIFFAGALGLIFLKPKK